MALNTQLQVKLLLQESGALDFGSPVNTINYEKLIAWATGTGLNQANMCWSDNRNLSGSSTETLDLAAGGLIGALGNALTFARVKGILVACRTGKLTIARPAANGFPLFTAAGDSIQIENSSGATVGQPGLFLWTNATAVGVVVTGGTGDLIEFSSALDAVNYDIHIWGAAS